MRKKAENEIRRAVESLGTIHRHRIDKVRVRTALIRKVFDKTILHMAQVGTIALHGEGAEALTSQERRDLIWQGDILHVSFSFIDGTQLPMNTPPAPPAPMPAIRLKEKVSVTLEDLDKADWERFHRRCEALGKAPAEVIWQMILDFNRE